MRKQTNNLLFSMIHDYLMIHLPKQRNLSQHTIDSYRKALDLLVDFVKVRKKVSLQDVTFEMLTPETITAFLDSLEEERECGIPTRNNRLAAIRAFVKFAADRDITTVEVLAGFKKVVTKKPKKAEVVAYMSMAAISEIVERADVSTQRGLRDRTFLILLYDTGARIDEMVKTKLCDLRFGKTPTIILHGKCGKDRSVPLMEKTVRYLQSYLANFHPDAPLFSDLPLFYTVTHGNLHALSDRRMRYIIKEYGEEARKHCVEVPENVHPHMFRHSRAMHLYQNGMDLTLVSQWLGHARFETTRMYAYADTEHKRKAIEAATPPGNPLFAKLNPERYKVSDEETLKRLTGLAKF